jgi:N-acetylglucosaminyldiphosphoundecaprenol N-acetyl-beta-D-mannosaminyltransferase
MYPSQSRQFTTGKGLNDGHLHQGLRPAAAQSRRPAKGIARLPMRLSRRPEDRVRVLGVRVDLVKPVELFNFVDEKIATGEKVIIANHNLHSVYLAHSDTVIGAYFEKADLVQVDSVPLIFWARLMGRPSRRFHRSTYLDWRDEFWARAEQAGWRVFFVGGADGVAERAAEAIRTAWPNVRLATHHGYFDADPASAENAEILDQITAFEPDVLLVGMGMPRQELWVWNNSERLPNCAIFTVGGAFDYEAGIQTPAPRWVGEVGAEWLFRLLRDPPRMFHRYCIEPWNLWVPAWQDIREAVVRRLSPSNRSAGAPILPSRRQLPSLADRVRAIARPD